MSETQNTPHEEAHASAHTGPIKTPGQTLLAVVVSFVVPVFAIIGLVFYVSTQFKPQAGVQANDPRSVEQRIAKVGTVEIKDGSSAPATGEAVYKAQCSACHASGVMGAPKFEDKTAWSPRISSGYEALLKSALEGKNAMPKQAGGEFDEVEIGRAVVYMANAAGAKFAMPERTAAPAASGSAPDQASADKK